MSWQITGRARVDPERPKAFGVCDRCGFLYQLQNLQWQFEWAAQRLQNLRILVCDECRDKPQEQLRRIVLPPDPIPIADPRVGEFGSMIFSSLPQTFNTIVPSQLTVENSSGATLGTIGDRSPIVTQLSSLPILTEVTVTLTPYGYDGPGDTNTPALNQLTGWSTTTSS